MYIVGKYKSCLPKLQKNVGEKKQQIFSKLSDFFFAASENEVYFLLPTRCIQCMLCLSCNVKQLKTTVRFYRQAMLLCL